MLLHVHHLDNLEGNPEVYVVHVAPVEARTLADAIYAALGRDPDAESYSITLGLKADLDRTPELPSETDLVLPNNGLIVP